MEKALARSIKSRSVSALRYLILWGCILIVSTQLALAAGGGSYEKASIGMLFWPAVNFALYATVIYYAYKNKAAPALKQQRAELKELATRGRSELAAAQQEFEAAQAQRDDIENEKKRVIEQLNEEGARLAGRIIEQAASDVQYSKRDVERRISGQRSKVETDLRAAVVRAATSLARAELPEQIRGETDSRLRQQAVAQFKS